MDEFRGNGKESPLTEELPKFVCPPQRTAPHRQPERIDWGGVVSVQQRQVCRDDSVAYNDHRLPASDGRPASGEGEGSARPDLPLPRRRREGTWRRKPVCVFCRNSGERLGVYRSHTLKVNDAILSRSPA